MYAITGITGKVGGAVARQLLADAQSVRAVLRDTSKGKQWSDRGCEIAQATMGDASSLSAAFKGAAGVFVLPPSEFDPDPGFAEALVVIEAVKTALAVRDEGVLSSFLQPLDKRIPMIATADVGRVAAELLQQNWNGCRVVELEARNRVSPNDAASTFAKILGRPVKAHPVSHDTWEGQFKSQGMRDPALRIKMLDGFNDGWIEFEGTESSIVRGDIELDTVLRELLSQAYPSP